MAHSSMTMNEENLHQPSDLVRIFDSNEINPILIHAHQLNPYFHTLLGHPFRRLKYYHREENFYQFYRTPGIISYIITYYLHHGCLSTETNYPPEILYDELIFFGFNIQIVYGIVSNLITIEFYIPSNKYRRALWFLFQRHRLSLIDILCRLIDLSSFITSIILLELINMNLMQETSSLRSMIHRSLITDIFICLFTSIEFVLYYLIRPKLFQTTVLLFIIHLVAWLPISPFLYRWSLPDKWLYTLLVLQLGARIIRCLRLSSGAYHLVSILSKNMSLCLRPCRSIILIVIFFSLMILSFEQISSPVKFLNNSTNSEQRHRDLFNDIFWIGFNAFTAVGEGTSRPWTRAGLFIEFVTCLIGMISIPQLVRKFYSIASKTIDEQKQIEAKRTKKHLVLIEDEYGHRAIGQLQPEDQLPEILIEKDEF